VSRYDVSVNASCVESVGIHAHLQLSSYCSHQDTPAGFFDRANSSLIRYSRTGVSNLSYGGLFNDACSSLDALAYDEAVAFTAHLEQLK